MTEGSSAPATSAGGPIPLPQKPSVTSWFRGPRAAPLAVAAAVLVGALLLLAALLGAFGSGTGTGPTVGGPATTYDAAQAAAAAIVGSRASTTAPLTAIGLDLANTTTVPVNTSGIPNCTETSLTGLLPSSVVFPAFHGNLLSGVAEVWLLDYLNPTIPALVSVAEVGGSVVLAVEVSGARCLGLNETVQLSASAKVVDSSVAASTAAGAGAASFVASHPTGVSLLMALAGALSLNGSEFSPVWQFDYSTCPIAFTSSPITTAGVAFYVGVNATTGAVLPGSVENATCGGVTPPTQGIGNNLQFGPPDFFQGAGSGGTIATQGCASADYCYSFEILLATNVTPEDFQLSVENATSHVGFLSAGYAILSSSGQVVVYSTGPNETAWTSGVGTPSTPLVADMSLVVDLGTTYPPTNGFWFLEITGEGPYTGSGEGLGL